MGLSNVVCPISFEKIDSNVSRITVFLNVLMMGAFIFTLRPEFMIVVAIDYIIRGAIKMEYSPIRVIAKGIATLLKIAPKPVGSAPKIFASRLGIVCSTASLALVYTGYPLEAQGVAGMFMGLAFMDAAFNFCVGCLIYNYIVLPIHNRQMGK